MFLLNSCLGQFSAASSHWHSFSRSYGVILPSSLTMLLPSALGFSPHLPVSVYGTGTVQTIAAFLGSWLTHFPTFCSVCITSSDCHADLPTRLLPRLPRDSIPASALPLRPHSSVILQYRNFNLLSIGYVFRPHLRPPTYPEQISFTLETLDIRPEGFSPSSRYSFRHSLFLKVHSSFRYCFFPLRMLLYQLTTLIPELR